MSLRTAIGCACSAIVLCVGVQAVCAAPPPQVSWAAQAGGTGEGEGQAISALPDGSSIVTGKFSATASFGSTTLTTAGGTCADGLNTYPCFDVFTAKMNADGTWAWATTAGGTGDDYGYGVSALPDGSSIVTGAFSGTATFGSTSLANSEGICPYDSCAAGFTAKMNADGTWAWATKFGGPGDVRGDAISALPDGSSIVTGRFSGTATFGSTTLTSETNFYDLFTAKINANGTWAWATKITGTGGNAGNAISALPDGSSILIGYFIDTATFGSTTLTSPGIYAAFTAKMNADGTWAWATKTSGTGKGNGWGISALPDGSSIVTGDFSGTATFGSSTLTTAGGTCGTAPDTYPCYDVFTAKMNADGTWAWATRAGGTGYDDGFAISALSDGSSMVTGVFTATATFGDVTLTSEGDTDVFTAKINADGTWAWATRAGGTGEDEGNGISALPDGSSVLSGEFSGTATFGGAILTTAGSTCGTAPDTYPCTDVFTARYLDAPQAPAAPVAVAGNASAAVAITPLAGRSVTSYTVTSTPGKKTCTVVAPATSCTVNGLANRTSYTFAATATNAAGTGAASASSNAVTPTAPPIKGKVHCVATTCVTTGSVPTGATRITQRATSRPAGHSATGTCTIRRTSTKRTYSCTVHLSQGTWVITTTAHTRSAAKAHFSKRVRVAPRTAPVTG